VKSGEGARRRSGVTCSKNMSLERGGDLGGGGGVGDMVEEARRKIGAESNKIDSGRWVPASPFVAFSALEAIPASTASHV
jgi:hypothetical protein